MGPWGLQTSTTWQAAGYYQKNLYDAQGMILEVTLQPPHVHTNAHVYLHIHVHNIQMNTDTHTHTSKCIPMHRGSYFVEKKQGNPICHGIWTLDQVQMNNDYTWDHGNWRQSSRDIKPASGPSVDYSNSCLQVNYRRPFLPLVLTVKRLLIKDKQLSYCESYVILLSY